MGLDVLGCTFAHDSDTSRDVLMGAILTIAGLFLMGYGAGGFSSTTDYLFSLR